MKNLYSLALRCENNVLLVLDQRQLPHKESWLVCHNPDHMVEIIQSLAVRGAPLIGLAAALSLALFAQTKPSPSAIEAAAKELIAARPTAVNLSFCIHTQLQAYHQTQSLDAFISVAERLFEEDKQFSEAIANHGASLLQSGESILTHCNTGGLVTAGIGTALGAIFRAHQLGKKIHVYVNETRPLLQGGRLTSWELIKANIPHTLCCDNMAAVLMRQQKIQRVITGADRIARNGDTANKIGTYGIAALAQFHHLPFHIAAPKTTIDFNCPNGDAIHIEERNPEEVKGFAEIQWAPKSSPVFNPAFDVTPHQLITSYILDTGIYTSISATAPAC